jgi:hypothetical protein
MKGLKIWIEILLMEIRECRRVSKSNQSGRADDVQTTLEKTEQHLMRRTADVFGSEKGVIRMQGTNVEGAVNHSG